MVLGCALLFAAAWLFGSLVQPVAEVRGQPVEVSVAQGSGLSQIAQSLRRQQVIHSATFFKLRVLIAGRRSEFKPGVYLLRRQMPYGAVMARLAAGPAGGHLTVPEGSTRPQVAGLAQRAGVTGDYLNASLSSGVLDPARYGAQQAPDLEGFLFPGTYSVDRGVSAQALVSQQLELFRHEFARIDLGFAQAHHHSAYDVVTIASMVEAETAAPAERPLVASVIYNRLDRQMPLGIDATVRFATQNWTQPLSPEQLAIASPYNTRLHPGLPPGPINSPGMSALQAAAHPAQTPFVYYVAKPGTCGEHSFSADFGQFQKDSRFYQDQRALNGGREPTTCPIP